MKIIKTRLEGAKRVWSDELPGVLWAYRTTVRTPMGETPFKLAYGSETVIPAEVHMASHRVKKYQAEENKEQLRLNLDLMDEVRMDAEQRIARYKNLIARQYDAMVKPRHFNIEDIVLKRPWQQETWPMGNWGQIGKDLIGLSIAKGKDLIIWKLWIDRG